MIILQPTGKNRVPWSVASKKLAEIMGSVETENTGVFFFGPSQVHVVTYEVEGLSSLITYSDKHLEYIV